MGLSLIAGVSCECTPEGESASPEGREFNIFISRGGCGCLIEGFMGILCSKNDDH